MNCPYCRKKLWYWAFMSNPLLGRLTYACQRCQLLFHIEKCDLQGLPSWQGVRIMRAELTRRGYDTPPVKKGATLKAAPPRAKGVPDRGL